MDELIQKNRKDRTHDNNYFSFYRSSSFVPREDLLVEKIRAKKEKEDEDEDDEQKKNMGENGQNYYEFFIGWNEHLRTPLEVASAAIQWAYH